MMKQIIYDSSAAMIQYMPIAAILAGVILAGYFAVESLIFKKPLKQVIACNSKKILLIFIFFIYCFTVISLTILSRAPGSRTLIRPQLFSTFSRYLIYNVFPVENILLFIPFGMLLPLLGRRFRKAGYCLGAGLLSSILIESVQYITKRGYVETDDVIMNFLGTALGYIFITGLLACFISKERKT